MGEQPKLRLVLVGAFPAPTSTVHGGIVSACRALLQSSLPERAELVLVDSTQRSVPPPPILIRARYAFARGLQVVRLLRRRPDGILMFAAGGASLIEKGLYAWYARWRGVRSLLFVQAGVVMDRARQSAGYRRVAKLVFRGPDRLLCQGPTWQRFFEETFGFPPERCPVITNWTATPDYIAVGARRSYGDATSLRVLFMGWLSPAKGLFELLEAVRVVSRRTDVPRIELDICGEGAASMSAREWVQSNGLAEVVRFHGWVEGTRKLGLFERANVFALPSHHEGLPNAMIEAMAAGLPVVVTPVGCVPDVITDRRDGLLVPVKDAERLGHALYELASSPALRMALGRAAWERARQEFGVETAVDRLLAVFDELTCESSTSEKPEGSRGHSSVAGSH